ncbi:M48 family metallopeptidase [Actinophytocola glycyrrhizae]|uniref:M48 family metallopeptidase n=1 Tax=Actinophytocola glycyrrhizae TaxID=2044873 RepID=A0ABV9SDN6_9PSEU
MNFFQRQQDVRKSSRRLVVLFVVAVLTLVVVVDLIAFFLLGLSEQPTTAILDIMIGLSLFLIVAIGLTSLFRMLALKRGGGGKVAQSLGGLFVPADTADPRLRRLRNVVEEMAIASGTPVPEVYVLPHEPGINAFAAGFTPADAAVAVTHGALERLNRDELQGVIAHEFSHVVNGDMRLNIRLMGVLFGILGLAVIGRILMSIRGERNPLPLIGLVLLVVGYIGVFFGRLIKAAVSRQREYLADASAVQYTRQTEGLVGALKKIGGLPEGAKLRDKRSEDVSHMLFGEGFANWFATHPPIEQRIRTLDPAFDPAQFAQLTSAWQARPPDGMREDEALGLAPPGEGPLPPPNAAMPVQAAHVVASIGTVSQQAAHQRAGSIIAAIPAPLLDRARHPDTVLPLVLGLLMAQDPHARATQQAIVASRFGPSVADAATQDAQTLASLHPVLRLPIAELAFPVLRRRPRPQQDAVLACIHALAQADGVLTLREYCLSRLLHRELYESVHHTSPWAGRRAPRQAVDQAVATLLAVLAAAGGPGEPEDAYRAGLAQVVPGQPLPFTPVPPVMLENVWPVLDGLGGPEKEHLVTGMVTVIGHDDVATVSEIELLRTVCALIHCPLPPLADARPEQVTP